MIEDGAGSSEAVFPSEWEGRVFALSFCSWLSSGVTVDESRSVQASMPYARYYGSSYYERWLYSLEELLVRKGVATDREIAGETEDSVADFAEPSIDPNDLRSVLVETVERGIPRSARAPAEPLFRPGQEVRVSRTNGPDYDRLPAYVKGRSGTIESHSGSFARPEDLAAGRVGLAGAHCYCVRFGASELWGESAESDGDSICIDLFESYLEVA